MEHVSTLLRTSRQNDIYFFVQLPCTSKSKSKSKRSPAVTSPAVASAPTCSNPVLADVVHDDEEDLPFIASSNPVSIVLFCFTFI